MMAKKLLDTLDPIFADCLGEEGQSPYPLSKPWIRDGFAYATNGCILVRQPTRRRTGSSAKVPDAWHLFDDSKPFDDPIPLPDIGLELGNVIVCGTCKGEKPKPCKNCKTSGDCACPQCGIIHGCGECDGHGQEKLCSECGGEGTLEREGQAFALTPGADFGLADRYIWLLRRHGINEVRCNAGMGQDARGFCFHKGKVEGLVMGCEIREKDG